jgi:hypothetical protein
MSLRPIGRPGALRAFTMVEVVLAVAAAAIGLLALFGLLSRAVIAVREAADMSLAATIAEEVLHDIRSQPYAEVHLLNFSPGGPYDLRTESGTVSNYYSADGLEIEAADAYFKLLLGFEPQSPSLTRVRADIVWPAAAVAPSNTNTFFTMVTR